MKRPILGFAVLCAVAASTFAADDDSVRVQRLSIQVPAEFEVVEGQERYPLSFGSGLEFASQSDDELVFYGITDRGPNLDGPQVGTLSSKVFPAPSFVPSIYEVRVRGDVARAVRRIALNVSGKNITGLPVPPGAVGFTQEAALSIRMEELGNDPNGLDPEAIRLDPSTSDRAWICDEYGPFVAQIDLKTGAIVQKWAPGAGLPEILKKRQPNRGFEGLAVTKSGKIVAAVQSILDVDGAVKKSSATFTRLIWIDPKTKAVKTFAYPHARDAYKASADAKIGDLVALGGSETEFLIVEQGNAKDGSARNVVYRIDLKDASDLGATKTANGQELETLKSATEVEALGIRFVRKTPLFDLRALGWTAEKAEGLAIVDARTIAVVSDSDFQVQTGIENPAKTKEGKTVKVGDYTLKNGKLYASDVETNARIRVERSSEVASFWLVKLGTSLY